MMIWYILFTSIRIFSLLAFSYTNHIPLILLFIKGHIMSLGRYKNWTYGHKINSILYTQYHFIWHKIILWFGVVMKSTKLAIHIFKVECNNVCFDVVSKYGKYCIKKTHVPNYHHSHKVFTSTKSFYKIYKSFVECKQSITSTKATKLINL